MRPVGSEEKAGSGGRNKALNISLESLEVQTKILSRFMFQAPR